MDAEGQARFFGLLNEPLDDGESCPKQVLDFFGGTVGRAQLDDFGRLAMENVNPFSLAYCQTTESSALPDPAIIYVDESRIALCEQFGETRRQVFLQNCLS